MGYNDQFIPLEEKVFPIPEEAFADANMPTDSEAMAWVNINVPMDNRNGSLAVYNRPGDEVSTTTFAFIWMVVENPILNIVRIKDINTSGTKWFFGSGAPNPVLGVPNDFYYRTSNCDILNKHITLGWQIVGNAKGIQGDVGPSPQMQVADGKIQWKRDNIITWYDLISLAELIGPQGPAGPPMQVSGVLEDEGDLPVSGSDGDAYVIDGELWVWTGSEWVNIGAFVGPQGVQGVQGESGENGKEVELQNNGTNIQWRYIGDVGWTNLVTLASITGQKGDKGDKGDKGANGDKGDKGDKGNTGSRGFIVYPAGEWSSTTTYTNDGDNAPMVLYSGVSVVMPSAESRSVVTLLNTTSSGKVPSIPTCCVPSQ